jgi:putative FmdB family regulatory protein
MPLYDYYCEKCRWFEARRGLEASFTPCPTCGEPAKRADVSGIPGANTETVGFKTSKQIVRG